MTKVRNVLGLLAALILLLSACAHSFLGWPSLRSQLEATHAPADLVQGLRIGWQFGGVAMVLFAIIMIVVFVPRLRGENVSPFPALAIGIAYLAFAVWAFALTKNPFFSVFFVPAVLSIIAGWKR